VTGFCSLGQANENRPTSTSKLLCTAHGSRQKRAQKAPFSGGFGGIFINGQNPDIRDEDAKPPPSRDLFGAILVNPKI